MSDPCYKTYRHNPPHYFEGRKKYFITAASHVKKPYFKEDKAKELILNSIIEACKKYKWVLEEWVILDNHYHLMLAAPEEACSLSSLVRYIHQAVAYRLKQINPGLKNEKIFHNYWDTCIDYERSYFSRISYIFMNPVKHGYIDNPHKYKWSSLSDGVNGRIIKDYPCNSVNVEDDF